MAASSLPRPTRSLSCWPVYCSKSTFVSTIAPLRRCWSSPTGCARLSIYLGYPITLPSGGSPGTSWNPNFCKRLSKRRCVASSMAYGDPLRKTTRVVALDSTGLFLSYSSRYFRWRAKRDRGQRGWLKWALALWVEPQMLVAQRVRPGPSGDFSDLVPLAESANTLFLPFEQLLADAGYDSEANHRFCREVLGVESLIRAKARRSKTVVAKTPYRKEMCRGLGEPGDPVLREQYRQRWKAETAMSVAKRKWGEALSARREKLQKKQLLLRGVTYNLHRLVLLGILCVSSWYRKGDFHSPVGYL